MLTFYNKKVLPPTHLQIYKIIVIQRLFVYFTCFLLMFQGWMY